MTYSVSIRKIEEALVSDIMKRVRRIIIALELNKGHALACDLPHFFEADEALEDLVELFLLAALRQVLYEENLVGLWLG